MKTKKKYSNKMSKLISKFEPKEVRSKDYKQYIL